MADLRWEASSSLAVPALHYRFATPCPCQTFEVDRVYLLGPDSDSGDPLTVLRGDDLFILAEERTIELDLTRTSTGRSRSDEIVQGRRGFRQAWLDPDGSIWIVQNDALLRWRPGAPPETVLDAAAFGCLPEARCLAGGASTSRDGDYEAVLVTRKADESGEVERETEVFVASRAGARRLEGLTLFRRDFRQSGRAALLGPGRAVFTADNDSALGRIELGSLHSVGGPGEVQLMQHTNVGLLVGSYRGEVRIVDPDTLSTELLRDTSGASTIGRAWMAALSNYGLGAVAANEDGTFRQIFRGLDLCPAQVTSGFNEVTGLEARGQELVFTGNGRDNELRVEVWRPARTAGAP
jgi:hypothetical protein